MMALITNTYTKCNVMSESVRTTKSAAFVLGVAFLLSIHL
jgi:hypothetical protein